VAQEEKVDFTVSSTHRDILQRIPDDCPLSVRWAVPLLEDRVRSIHLPPPDLDVPLLVVLTEDNALIAFNRSNGEALWKTGLNSEPWNEPTFSAFSVFVIVDGRIVKLDRYQGRVLWSLRAGFAPSPWMRVSELQRGEEVLVNATMTQVVRASSVQRDVWPPTRQTYTVEREDLSVPVHRLISIWRYAAGGLVDGPLAYKDGLVIGADTDGGVFCLNSARVTSGRPEVVWQTGTRGSNGAGVLLREGSVYVPSRDRNLYCFGMRKGALAWRYNSGYLLTATPSYVKDPATEEAFVLQPAEAGPLLCLDAGQGEEQWMAPNGAEVVGVDFDEDQPVRKRTTVILRNRDGTVEGRLVHTGERQWTIPADLFETVAPNASDRSVYATADGGRTLVSIGRRR
jgi:outer membrane protein assembly factor BamB